MPVGRAKGGPAPEQEVDGRRQRGLDNRRRARSAFLELVHEGVISPTAEDVAHRAGVGLRSVFRYFPVMEELYAELATHVDEIAREILLRPCGAVHWKERMAEAANRRAALFEKILPYQRSIEAHRYESGRLDEHQKRFAQFLGEALVSELGDFLPHDKVARRALIMMLGQEAWSSLRREQGLSRKGALAVVLSACESLVGKA